MRDLRDEVRHSKRRGDLVFLHARDQRLEIQVDLRRQRSRHDDRKLLLRWPGWKSRQQRFDGRIARDDQRIRGGELHDLRFEHSDGVERSRPDAPVRAQPLRLRIRKAGQVEIEQGLKHHDVGKIVATALADALGKTHERPPAREEESSV